MNPKKGILSDRHMYTTLVLLSHMSVGEFSNDHCFYALAFVLVCRCTEKTISIFSVQMFCPILVVQLVYKKEMYVTEMYVYTC